VTLGDLEGDFSGSKPF